MATTKKTTANSTKKKETVKKEEKIVSTGETTEELVGAKIEAPEEVASKPVKKEKPNKSEVKIAKYPIGSIVYVAKDADADLNGFKLFPQYKKYTYTVEAYDGDRDIYSLRRLNLLLKLKKDDIVAPEERAHDSLNRKQF